MSTIANGADSIAVYAPLFATSGQRDFATTVILFAVWCAAGFLIGTHRTVVGAVHWAGDYAIRVVLIAVGIFVITRSGLLGRSSADPR